MVFHTVEAVVLTLSQALPMASLAPLNRVVALLFRLFQVLPRLVVMVFQTAEAVFLMDCQALEMIPIIPLSLSLKKLTMPLQAWVMPLSKPLMIKLPCWAMTVEGEWMPNTDLNPLIKGWKMLSFIQELMPAKASPIPLKIP